MAENISTEQTSNASTINNLNSATSSINSVINLSNEVSIGNRIAMSKNPFDTYAAKISALRFASVGSDMSADYVDIYDNSLWGNVFGGANIIDGDSGAIYGATIGYDRKVGDNALLGVYFTYANAEVKDKLIKQESDNFQLGVYSNITFAKDYEANFKIYGQISPTDQSIYLSSINGTNTSDFTRKSLGISADVGKNFSFSDNTFIVKPFIGANYYFTKTPSYKESGTMLAKDVSSSTNNTVSLEIGAELRKYFSENSYIYTTPKIEQYVVNNGDHYVSSLNGVTLPKD
ncbi:MAG: autotransporter outer membrane beta-barrel domain-containing protein [Campylobacter sp.]|nr:autotransporter outer membrane beta-barrel domain-containing protein [Campylobacter sp.]